MTEPVVRQYGLWDSPIKPISMARGLSFSGLMCDQKGVMAWLEGRSDRGVLVVQANCQQASRDLNSELSVRAKVGYGGGDFSIHDGNVFFVEAETGRIYRQPAAGGAAQPITPAFGQSAAPKPSPDGKWLAYINTYEGMDSLALVDTAGALWPRKLVDGDDFYMQPAWSPDGKRLAWIAWDHPNMPWDGTFLRLGELQEQDGNLPALQRITTIAGGEQVSIFQPEFSPDGRFLAYVSDESGWWQLYLYEIASGEHRQLTHAQAEHGLPAWVQGMRTYAFSFQGDRLFFLRNQPGQVSLWQLDLQSGHEMRLPLDPVYTMLDHICATPGGVALVASGGRAPARIITFDGSTNSEVVWRRSTSEEIAISAYSNPQAITWAGMDGGQAHGLYFPPTNPGFAGTGKPPLIVRIHGGPTSQVFNSFNAQAQFFTSRGYAVLEVNYRGSTGYGRAYRNMLRGAWGIYDVQDAVSGARSLSERGLADLARLVIMGGSAGGFTVLKALEDYPGFFKAGICLFGVSNQFTLAAETHKFEAHYSDTLLGPLPEAADLYRERSPIFFVDRIQDPIAVFQGEIDVVVPRKQSDEVVASLQQRGVPHVYHVYPGEGHGFRKAETIEHFYKAVDQFLRQYVIFA
ncbi:MAG: S9 family peptidase [Anaerolineales bacterium]|nr:S9 family peptidase [Anaerolineales bacterium]